MHRMILWYSATKYWTLYRFFFVLDSMIDMNGVPTERWNALWKKHEAIFLVIFHAVYGNLKMCNIDCYIKMPKSWLGANYCYGKNQDAIYRFQISVLSKLHGSAVSLYHIWRMSMGYMYFLGKRKIMGKFCILILHMNHGIVGRWFGFG